MKRVALLLGCISVVAACDAMSEDGATSDQAVVPSANVHVQLVAFNDFHGNLDPPTGSSGLATIAGEDGGPSSIAAGGAAFMASHIRALAEAEPNTAIVSAGDLTGASPLLSNLFGDKPVTEIMSSVGLDFNGVGNHEFDRGLDALLDLQKSANYKYLAANVINDQANATIFPSYGFKTFGAAKVAFVGMTLEGTPSVTVAKAIAGLHFQKEVDTVNALVPELKKQGASAIVLLIHQGGGQTTKTSTVNGCEGFAGDILPIVQGGGLDPAVDVVVTGHTHQAYNCTIEGRLVTSALSYGRVLTKIDLEIDPNAHVVVSKKAENRVVTRDVTPDPDVAAIVAKYQTLAAPKANRVVGNITADVAQTPAISCETPLGDLIADAQQDATSADVAFMNPGGIRTDLVFAASGAEGDGVVTYAEAFATQPFANNLVTMKLTGEQILGILKQQFTFDRPTVLQISKTLAYHYVYDAATKSATIDNVTVAGAPLDPAKSYKIVANAFLAGGGDGFPGFEAGTERVTGDIDLDALVAWLGKTGTVAPPTPNRIDGDACR